MKQEDIKITPKWSKSKDDIWNEIFDELEVIQPSMPVRRISFWKYSVAAVILILLTGTITARFYSASEVAARGTHVSAMLPDGSKVILNAESKLTYYPYWWYFSRSVTLDGEAYFEVKSGEKFSVKSNKNEVNVLGTSFTVFSRMEKYSVTCLTGKVKVFTDEEVSILNPNMRLTYLDKKISVEKNIDEVQSTGWIKNKFVFVSLPLVDVISEIERQYNINIIADKELNYFYTGNFVKTDNPDEVLEIIGKPFGIKFSIK